MEDITPRDILESVREGDYDKFLTMVEKVGNFLVFHSSIDDILHEASFRGNEKIVDYLLKINMDVNKKDWRNKTPIHHAVESGNLPIVEILIDYGADLTSEDMQGNSPILIGIKSKNTPIVKMLFKKLKCNGCAENKCKLLNEAALSGNIIIFQEVSNVCKCFPIMNGNLESLIDSAKTGGNQDIVDMISKQNTN